jgi:hypothetical protein
MNDERVPPPGRKEPAQNKERPPLIGRKIAVTRSSVGETIVWQLQFDYLKQISTLALACAGGEITLLHTVFLAAPYKVIAYLSILLLLLATILCTEAQEILVDRLAERAKFPRTIFWSLRIFGIPRTQRMQQSMASIAGMLFGAGILIFVAFVLGSYL